MKGSVFPFIVSFALFALLFYALDWSVMAARGLNLIYRQ